MLDADFVGSARAGDLGFDLAAFDHEVVGAAGARVGAAAGEAPGVALQHALESFDPALPPPRGAKLVDLDAALRRRSLGRIFGEALVAPRTHDASRCSSLSTTALLDSENSSRSSLCPSSVIHCSPLPTTRAA